MESHQFDALVRSLHEPRSRRTAFGALLAGLLGPFELAAEWAAGASLSLQDAIAEVDAFARTAAGRVEAGRAATERVTARERDVLRLLVRGWSDKEIAAALGIARRTVSNHVVTIRAKLDAPSRAAAAAIAARDHLV